MADKSNIEWTDATWNPIVGCSIVSPGCTNCYAMKMAARIEHMGNAPHYDDMTQGSKAGPVWTGKISAAPKHVLDQPLRWKAPRRIFVNSMGDLHHESSPVHLIDHVVAVMWLTPRHTYQLLTKRAANMQRYWSDPALADRIAALVTTMCSATVTAKVAEQIRAAGFPNVWLGVSTERQQEADERIPLLLQTPAAVRFISAEPLLGPIDLERLNRVDGRGSAEVNALGGEVYYPGAGSISSKTIRGTKVLDWVIVGGESGHGARPMHPDWARSLRDQCAAADVPFFFKQWGQWSIGERILRDDSYLDYIKFQDGDEFHVVSDGHDIVLCGADDAKVPTHLWRDYWADGHGNLAKKVGKKTAGRLLDGKEHNGFPTTKEAAAA